VQEGSHRNNALVIDRNGKIRNSFDLVDPTKVEELKTLVRQLLDEKASPDDQSAAEPEQPASTSPAEPEKPTVVPEKPAVDSPAKT
jgi:hypothetical protein